MIHKINYLKSIGKFRNYTATGEVAFKKLTTVFGDNGSGKTTLTAVLRSLTTNDPNIIRNRNSTNSTIDQSVQIVQRDIGLNDTHHTFGAQGWDNALPNIEIFDIHFVNENVYSGFDFSDAHKKQLHHFVIGAQAVAIQQRIETNKTTKEVSRQRQQGLILQIVQQVGNNLTENDISTFLSIVLLGAINIDQKTAQAEIVLQNARANDIIQTFQSLVPLNVINTGIDFDGIITDLTVTSQTIQDEALQTIFENHCQDLSQNGITGHEQWLRQGFDYLKAKEATAPEGTPITLTCPFCKQSVDSTLDIIKAFTIRFNDEFNALVARIETHRDSLQSFNLDLNIQNLNNSSRVNTDRIANWVGHLPAGTVTLVFNIIADEVALRTELQTLIEAVNQKLQNPSMAVPTGSVTIFRSSIDTINSNIQTYNESIAKYNEVITTFKSGIISIAQAQTELERLNRIKRRFDPAIDALCINLLNEKQSLRTLEQQYTTLMEQAETTANQFFSRYQTRINYYLVDVFKIPFRMVDVTHIPPQGPRRESKVNYKLQIDGHDIAFQPNQSYNAKDVLSEGDKSTIALAFFLSKLDIDPNKNDKILVFDDPLSSLDSNRRAYTVGIIKTLIQSMKQVVVLSHNESFLYEVVKDIPAVEKKSLRITENFVERASLIEPCDLDELVEIDYFKQVKALEDFRTTPDLGKKETVLGWLRNVLEAHIKFKFYRQTKHLPANGRTFGRLIHALDEGGVVFRDQTNRTEILMKLRLINAVSLKPHHGEPNPDFAALGLNSHTLSSAELDKLIVDTLNLIDDQL